MEMDYGKDELAAYLSPPHNSEFCHEDFNQFMGWRTFVISCVTQNSFRCVFVKFYSKSSFWQISSL